MEKNKRSYGSGTVEPYGKRFRVRLPRQPDGGRPVAGVYDTEEEANRMLDALLVVAEREHVLLSTPETVRTFGERFLDRRENQGLRNVKTDRSRWKHHIETAPFIDSPLQAVARRHVRDWILSLSKKRAADARERRVLSFSSRKHALNLVRAMFNAAVEDELINENPAANVKLIDDGKTDDGWTYLTLEEQTAITANRVIPEADRLRILFAIYTGLRQGEQWNLELADLRHEDPAPHVVVRRGSKGRSPKSKRLRRVPLLPAAVLIVRRWLELLPGYAKKNPESLAWPTPRGCRRQKGKLYGFKIQLGKAGITRSVRWHDLRHTCGSSLVAGWWGRPWRLEEVREVLGHASITMTERYAHLAPSVISQAAAETKIGHELATKSPVPASGSNANPAGFPLRARQESNLRPTAPEAVALSS